MLEDAEAQNKTIDYAALGLETEQPEYTEIQKERLKALNSSTIRLMQIADKIVDRVQGGKQFSKFRVNDEGVVDVRFNKRRVKKRLKDGWTKEDLNFIDDDEVETIKEKKKIDVYEDKLDGFFMMSGNLEQLKAKKHELFYLSEFVDKGKRKKNKSASKKKKKAKAKKKKGDKVRKKEKKSSKATPKTKQIKQEAPIKRKSKNENSPKESRLEGPKKRVENSFIPEDLRPNSVKIEVQTKQKERPMSKIQEENKTMINQNRNCNLGRENEAKREDERDEMGKGGNEKRVGQVDWEQSRFCFGRG